MSHFEALLREAEQLERDEADMAQRQNRFDFPEPTATHRAVMHRILELMKDGVRRSKGEIREALGLAPDVEITARIRDLRKPEHGAYCFNNPRSEGADDDHVYRYQMRIK